MKLTAITSHKYFIPITLFLLCFALYGNTLFNDYAGDDVIYTTQNKLVMQGFSAFKDIFNRNSLLGWTGGAYIQQYRPATVLNFMAEVSIFGLNPHISHFFNVLFFAFTVVLLYFFLQKILHNYDISVVIAATLLFAFHPIHTEVVANIKSRDEILALLFGLISFYSVMLYQEQRWQGRFLNRPYIFSLLAFFAALFCKETALTFTLIIPLLLYFFTPAGWKKAFLITIPYFILAGIYLFIRSRVLEGMTFMHPVSVVDNALMAATTMADRSATSFILLGKYIYMTVIPYPLSYDYSYNQLPVESWGNFKPIFSLLVCVALIVFALLGIKRKSVFSFCIFFFFITLSLSCNLFIQIACTFGERFLYTPSLGFCIALPVLIRQMSTFNIIIGSILIIETLIVIPRNAAWKNNFTLYSSGVITSPNSGKAHQRLGVIYMDTAQGATNPAKKMQYYSLAIKEFKQALLNVYWESYNDLGVCFENTGYPDSAITEYKKALETDPEYVYPYNNLGNMYMKNKQYDLAIPCFRNSYKYAPGPIPLINMAICYQQEGNFIMALHYDSLILASAIGYRTAALRDISIEHNNMGYQYVKNNELDNALKQFNMALKIDSNQPVTLKNISLLYEKKGDKERAKKYAQKAFEKQQEINAYKGMVP